MPLDPMYPGVRYFAFGAPATGPHRAGGFDRAVRVAQGPYEGTLVAHSEEGLVLLADSDSLVPSRPILMVPNVVRVGMSWTSRGGHGTADHTFTVKHRQEVETGLGSWPAWVIEQTSTADDRVHSRVYVEGHGLIASFAGAFDSERGLESLRDVGVDFSVQEVSLPRELRGGIEAEPAPVAPDEDLPIVLAEREGTEGRIGNRRIDDLTIVDDAGSGPGPLLIVSGRALFFDSENGILEVSRDHCLRFEGSTSRLHQASDCQPDVERRMLDPYNEYYLQPVAALLHGPEGEAPALYQATEPKLLMVHEGRAFELELEAALARGLGPWADEQLFVANNWRVAPLQKSLWPSGRDLAVRKIWRGDLGPAGEIPFVALIGDRLYHSVLDGGGVLSPLQPVGSIAGKNISHRVVAQGGDEVLLIDPFFNTVDRLEITWEGVQRERLAAIEPQPDRILTSAFIHEGDLIAIHWDVSTAHSLSIGDTAFSRIGAAKLVAEPTSNFEYLAPKHIEHGWNVEVCWAPTDELLQTEGWYLGGEPALAVQPRRGTNCAYILRDMTKFPAFLGEQSFPVLPVVQASLFHLLEGPVPGVGRMVFNTRAFTFDSPPEPPKDWQNFESIPMSDGGYVNPKSRYSPMGTWEAMSVRHPLALHQADRIEGQVVYDWNSHTGFYLFNGAGFGFEGSHAVVFNAEGATFLDYPDSFPNDSKLLVHPEGGVITTQGWWVKPDATLTRYSDGLLSTVAGFGPDGTHCGLSSGRVRRLQCLNPSDGTVTRQLDLPSGTFLYPLQQYFSDGRQLAQARYDATSTTTYELVLIDWAELTWEAIPMPEGWSVGRLRAWDAEGHPWLTLFKVGVQRDARIRDGRVELLVVPEQYGGVGRYGEVGVGQPGRDYWVTTAANGDNLLAIPWEQLSFESP